ncbi:MAG: hypothetical protein KIT84_23770 [Labilithrix sp.]|nr:hypothetical protein [Labilithrix sp.]MCW5814067.1 hypothetical protein [Labilithrix sp.]
MSTARWLRVAVGVGSAGALGVGVLLGACARERTCVDVATCEPEGVGDAVVAARVGVADGRQVVVQGEQTSIPVTLERQGASGDVVLSFAGAPDTVTIAPVVVPKDETAATVLVDVALAHPQGSLDGVTVTARLATGDTTLSEAPLPLFVRGRSGAIDTTFGGGSVVGTLYSPFTHAIRLDDGAVIAVGAGHDEPVSITRFGADGTLDSAFADAGVAITSVRHTADSTLAVWPHAAIDDAGRIVVSSHGLARFTAAGQPDGSWNGGGVTAPGIGGGEPGANFVDVAAGPQGTVLALESCESPACTQPYLRLARFTATGSLDTTYAAPIGARALLTGATLLPDGRNARRLALAGDGTAVVTHAVTEGTSRGGRVALVPPFGAAPASASFPDDRDITAVALTPGGGILVARNTGTPGAKTMQIQMLRSDLSPDPSFGVSAWVDGAAAVPSSVQVVDGGKVLVAGVFYDRHHVSLQRFMPDGKADTAYGSNGSIVVDFGTPEISGAFIQPDASVLVVGHTKANADSGARVASLIVRLWQ